MKYILFALMLTASSSCADTDIIGMVWALSPVPDQRFEQSIGNFGPMHGKCLEVDSNEYRFYTFGDSHVTTSTKNLDRFVADYLADKQAAPFAICLGDMISEKYYPTFVEHTTELRSADHYMYVCAGNHDLLFGMWDQFVKYYNSSTFWFEVKTPSEGKDLYISLDSASGSLGTKQIKWLEKFLADAKGKYRNIIVFTHTHMIMADFNQGTTDNFNLEETHNLMSIFADAGVNMVLTGHRHLRQEHEFRGVQYVTLDALKEDAKNPSYAICTISKGKTSRLFINLREE